VSLLPLPEAPNVPSAKTCGGLRAQEERRIKAWAVWLYRRCTPAQRSAIARAVEDTGLPLLAPRTARRAIERVLLADEMRGCVNRMIAADPRIARELPDMEEVQSIRPN